MASLRSIFNNFTAGELSPRLESRTDLNKYFNGLSKSENVINFPHGGLKRRAGSHFVAETKHSSLSQDKRSRLIEFEFNVTQAYVLEFGDLYIRFFTNKSQLISGTPVEVVSPYLESELREINYAQNADTVYLAHRNHAPRKLTRTSPTTFTLTTVSFSNKPSNFVQGTGTFPGAVSFHEERLIWGGSTNNPQTIWASKSGDFENMDVGAIDEDDAYQYTIGSNQVNLIRWLLAHRILGIGTASGEFQMFGGSNEPITPANVIIKTDTNYGSAAVRAIRVGRVVLFVQRMGTKVREFAYSFEQDSYAAPDLSLLSEHITQPGIVEMAYQQEPDSTLWCVLSDGGLRTLTYLREQDVIAWAKQPMDGIVESVASIPHPDGDRNQTWVIVKRTINSVTKRYVEYFDDKVTGFNTRAWKELNTDSALVYSGTPITTITGISHLEGKTVKIIANGAVYPDAVVTSGQVTISKAASEIEVGLAYNSAIITMRADIPGGQGTIQGANKNWSEVFVRLEKTLGVKINDEQVSFRKPSDPMDSAPPLFTGDKKVTNLGWDSEGRIKVEQTQPLPFICHAIFGRLNVGER